ncbi:MAG: DUF2267 domain-containing protein [Alphaproteobacteria bacterium]|jgi:uncharacterized protein (DUF2267 family)|nr:DUF2267 domain-containing protein [Alphaproteobacteria bacterium]
MTMPSVFARTVQQSQTWLKELIDGTVITDETKAFAALRAVLHHLRDRLIVQEAAQLGAQLPTLIRGVYYEGWRPNETPNKDRTADAFIAAVREELSGHPEIDPEIAVRAVFALLNREISQGEIEDVRQMLPEKVRELWPKAA